MALSLPGTPVVGTTNSIAIPTHAIGDLIIICAARSSGTLPTKPSAGGTVPTWTDIDTTAGSWTSLRTAYAVATRSNHSSGTWTNASRMACIVIRGQDTSTPLGGHNASGAEGANGGVAIAPAVTMSKTDGTSYLIQILWANWMNNATWNAAPSGYTSQASQDTVYGQGINLVTKNVTTSDGSLSIGSIDDGGSQGYRGATIEVLAPLLAVNRSAALPGHGALTVITKQICRVTKNITGYGALTVVTKQIVPVTKNIGGHGALTATAVATKFTVTKNFTGHGVLSATLKPKITKNLTGHGALTATARMSRIAVAVPRTGHGVLSATTKQFSFNVWTVSGHGALTSQAWISKVASAGDLRGHGALAGVLRLFATVHFSGSGAPLNVSAAVVMKDLFDSFTLQNNVTWTYSGSAAVVDGRLVLGGVAVTLKFVVAKGLKGSGALTAMTRRKFAVAKTLTGSGALTVTAKPKFSRGAGVVGHGVLSATATATQSPSPNLFFALPDVSSSPKKVLGHYFHHWQVSSDGDGKSGSNDYFATQFIPPNGESGSHAAVGGYMRNRPMPRALPPGDWDLADANTQVQLAIATGVDGFFCNDMSPGANGVGGVWGTASWYLNAYTKVRAAAANYPGFVVACMLDCSLWHATATSSVVATLQTYYGQSCTWMDNGAMVVGVYGTDNNTAAWWNSVVSACSTAGMTVKFVHLYWNYANWTQNTAPSQWACGAWSGPGMMDANGIAAYAVVPAVASVHTAGQKLLAPVWVQFVSPNSSRWWEALNTQALTNSWDKAIASDVDLVQLCTWSDYSESSVFNNSVAQGLVPLDVSAYYIAWWKTGSAPTILVDTIYLSYRNHLSNVTLNDASQTTFMAKQTYTGGGSSPTTFNVEALVFVTGAATVTITVAGTPHTFSPTTAGMFRYTVAAAVGSVSATIVRNSVTVASLSPPVPIRSSLYVDDWTYFMFGSIRGTTGQFDPQTTSTGAIPTYP